MLQSRARAFISAAPLVMLGSIVVLAALVALLLWNPMKPKAQTGDPGEPLYVHVAAGVLPPLEEIEPAFFDAVGIPLRTNADSSGGLLASIEHSGKGDLYIPGDDSFIEIARGKGLLAEVIPIASMRLVVAVAPGNPLGIRTLEDLFREGVTYALPNDSTASSNAAIDAMGEATWARLKGRMKVEQPTVSQIANVVKAGSVSAGFVWDATARQSGLEIVNVAELAGAESTISAAVLKSSKRPTDALRLARFLAAPDRGQKVFERHHYTPIPGDPWALEPEISIFAGGLNRVGVQQTIDEFRRREGIRFDETYNGCGVLVSKMKSARDKGQAAPDAYFACDASFTPDVADLFEDFETVSRTRMVMLVPKGNPRAIKTLDDLARPGLAIGMADEEMTALGSLTRRLLKQRGIYEPVRANVKATVPTADMLVLQLANSGSLDAVIVYEANCLHVKDKTVLIPIDDPAATAVQPLGISRQTRYPQLVARLRDAILTAQSKDRFEAAGFKWLHE